MLEIKSLSVTFHAGEALEKRVLHDINLQVEEGAFVCILGNNGSGKSTLFNALLGRLSYEGNVLLNGHSLDKLPTYKRCRDIGIVYQDPLRGSSKNLSVKENLLLAMPKGAKRKEFLERCKKELSSYGLGLEENFKTEVKNLSGGMRQALTLYMASLGNPSLLLLDEHIAALDPKASSRIMDITKSIHEGSPRLIILMIIHNLKMALSYGERLLLLKEGRIALDVKGKEKEELSEETLLQAYAS